LRSLLWLHYGREAFGDVKGYQPHIYYSTLCRFDEFLPGIAVAMLKNFHRDRWARLVQHGQAILLVGSLATAATLYLALRWYYIDDYGYGYFMTGFGYSLLAMAFAVLVIAALSPGSSLYRIRIPGAAPIAAWSYAAYLTHKPIGIIVARYLDGADLSSGSSVALVTAASVIGSWLLYKCVETPFMRLRDRYFPTNFPAERTEPLAQAAARA
jgi:peptidoglycan/LPS O-acetylase OafA/YrhL